MQAKDIARPVRTAFVAVVGALVLLGAVAGTPGPRAESVAPGLAAAPPVPAGDTPGYQGNVNGANWSGYVTLGAGFGSVSASWAAPTVRCTSTSDVVGPWVGLGGINTGAVQQTGLEVSCASGSPTYRAWYEIAPQPPVYYGDAAGPGDRFTAAVERAGAEYSLRISNVSRGWTRTTRMAAAQGDNTSAEVILESPNSRFPDFGQFTFTGATVDGRSFGSYGPVALDATSNGVRQNLTGPISGSTFTISFQHQ